MALIQCPTCGQMVSDKAPACPKCGHSFNENQPSFSAPQQPMTPKPSNYLVWSILSTFFCCLVGGVVAWVYSAKVDSAWYAGRYSEAIAYSEKAKTWNVWSIILATLGSVLYVFASIAGGY